MLLREILGSEIRHIRLSRGFSLTEVAQRAYISKSCLSELERGLKDPSSETFEAVCEALGLGVEDVIRSSTIPKEAVGWSARSEKLRDQMKILVPTP